MLLRTHFKNKYNHLNGKGFTYVELMVGVAIILLLIAFVLISYRPVERQKKARDEKRISDIALIDRAVSEYMLDHKAYPDSKDVTRKSNILPLGGTQLNSSVTGWIMGNLSSYTSMLPTDPINDSVYYYSYRHTSNAFELNAKLEVVTEEMTSDGGDDPNIYEVGNDLTLISP